MEGKSHAIIGGCAALAVGAAIHAPVADQFVMCLVGYLAGPLPDLDTESSGYGTRLPHWWHKITPGHRRTTHSIIWCLGLFLVAWWLQNLGHDALGWWGVPTHPYVPIALGVGAFSHVLADSITCEGVPFLYPWHFRFKVMGPLNFTTGTKPEHFVVMLVLLCTGSYFVYPFVHPHASGLVHSPPVLGVPTQPLLVFGIIMVIILIGYVGYRLFSQEVSPRHLAHCRAPGHVVHRARRAAQAAT